MEPSAPTPPTNQTAPTSPITPKACDNKSVGVIVRNAEGSIVLLKRARFPFGYAPVAGHVDDHGSVAKAAVDETLEEIGLTITEADLQATEIAETRFNNHCRRRGGTFHDWWVYIVDRFSGTLTPSEEETKGADWYRIEDVQRLADRTAQYKAQMIEQVDWEADPGLEEIWVEMLQQLGLIR
jgi:8-oxo-dGTP pyrophosphatase MutT (NUDIX family)